jgi:hypothetical protein
MAVKKIHSAPGLLLYRSKDKKLFVHGEKEWNELAMENEVSIISKCNRFNVENVSIFSRNVANLFYVKGMYTS